MKIFDASMSGSVVIANATETTGQTKFLVLDTSENVRWQAGGVSGTSGTAGSSGSSGTSGTGVSGSSGTSGTGVSGSAGTSGTSGATGGTGSSGTSGSSGSSGTSGNTGGSGTAGTSGTSGNTGGSGTAGTSGTSGILALTGTTANGVITYDGDGTGTVEANLTFNGSTLALTGTLTATAKSFEIKHPSKENYLLVHGSLEGPEHGVYYRGKMVGPIIKLPDYWKDLVDEDSITVHITSIGYYAELYVSSVSIEEVIIHNKLFDGLYFKYYFNIIAERKDIKKLEIEVKNDTNI